MSNQELVEEIVKAFDLDENAKKVISDMLENNG